MSHLSSIKKKNNFKNQSKFEKKKIKNDKKINKQVNLAEKKINHIKNEIKQIDDKIDDQNDDQINYQPIDNKNEKESIDNQIDSQTISNEKESNADQNDDQFADQIDSQAISNEKEPIDNQDNYQNDSQAISNEKEPIDDQISNEFENEKEPIDNQDNYQNEIENTDYDNDNDNDNDNDETDLVNLSTELVDEEKNFTQIKREKDDNNKSTNSNSNKKPLRELCDSCYLGLKCDYENQTRKGNLPIYEHIPKSVIKLSPEQLRSVLEYRLSEDYAGNQRKPNIHRWIRTDMTKKNRLCLHCQFGTCIYQKEGYYHLNYLTLPPDATLLAKAIDSRRVDKFLENYHRNKFGNK